MNKNTFTSIRLDKGTVAVYDFGAVKLHAYQIGRASCRERV